MRALLQQKAWDAGRCELVECCRELRRVARLDRRGRRESSRSSFHASSRSGRSKGPPSPKRRPRLGAGIGCAGHCLRCYPRTDRWRLLVRHRRPCDVDRRCICRSRQSRHLDRRLRHRQGDRRREQPRRRRGPSSVPLGRSAVPVRSGARRGAGRDRPQRSERAQRELPGHAGADQAGAGRCRAL